MFVYLIVLNKTLHMSFYIFYKSMNMNDISDVFLHSA